MSSWGPFTLAGGSLDTVYQKAFGRLRMIAQRLLSHERSGHTLQPTALVNEAYLKLRRIRSMVEGEEHFFHLAARAMKQVLIDHARVRGARIRVVPDSLPECLAVMERSELSVDLTLALKAAWERLRELDSFAAQTIWLRCVEGKTIEETSLSLGRTPSRVREDYDYGLKWMADQLGKRS